MEMDNAKNTYVGIENYHTNYNTDGTHNDLPATGRLGYVAALHQKFAECFGDCSSSVSSFGSMSNGVNEGTKTVLKEYGGRYLVEQYNDGTFYTGHFVMPTITNVRIYKDNNGNPRAIHMDFSDKTETCVVLQEGDMYNFEYALSICITKKILDMMTGGYGHQTYNKLVRKAKKVYSDNRAKDKAAQKRAEEEKRKYQKIEEKKRKRDERLEKEAREYEIGILKEAIIRALNECK